MELLHADSPVLRVWVLITGLAGLGAALGAYAKPLSPHKTLYARTPDTANASFARMYGTWLLTSTTIRVAFFLSASADRTPVFFLAFGTYVIAAFHFVTEIFVFRSAGLRPGGVAPLIVAGGSIVWFSAILLN